MKPKEIVVLCMDCGYQYITGFLLWKNRRNCCSNCASNKAQLLNERVNERRADS